MGRREEDADSTRLCCMKWPLRTEQQPYVAVPLLSARIRSGGMTMKKEHNKILKVGIVPIPGMDTFLMSKRSAPRVNNIYSHVQT